LNLRQAVAVFAAAAAVTGCTSPELPAFEHTLAAQDSATAALGEWCAARHLASPARITASPVHDADAPPPGDLRALLGADAIGYRHVRLSCGAVVLSEAHNWYLPSRLSPAMNATLTASDTPFGKVAAPLHFTRQPLDSRRGRGPVCPAHTVLSHRALLRLPDGEPLALVVECYTSANLGANLAQR
jgi:chorismate-pyruvate lyase